MNLETIGNKLQHVHQAVSKVLVGQDAVVEHVLIALLARGHVLVEGVPGLGKTLLVRALSHVLGLGFRRIQFTPDLMPSDVIGGNVYDTREGAFRFVPGPAFTQLLLADEVNRAPAKTQSALLEAMQERSVTVDGTTRKLPEPYIVIATQNPVESQGTYPLPEAQLDRFLFKLDVKHPGARAEVEILKRVLAGFDAEDLSGLDPVTNEGELLALQNAVRQVRVTDDVVAYIVDVVGRTRNHPAVSLGASPRAAVGIMNAARARALWEGRDFVIPDDVKLLSGAALRHRLLLQPEAELEGVTTDVVVDAVLRDAPVPKNVS